MVESIPVTNAIKARTADWRKHVDAWKDRCGRWRRNGMRTVCYNFMPIVDWTRTDLAFPLRSGMALRFDIVDLVAFDVFDLKRPHAADDYAAEIVAAAEERFEMMDDAARADLERIILAGLPGSDFSYDRDEVPEADPRLRRHDGGRLCAPASPISIAKSCRWRRRPASGSPSIPDDPPMPLFGLPRIVSTASDIDAMVGRSTARRTASPFASAHMARAPTTISSP